MPQATTRSLTQHASLIKWVSVAVIVISLLALAQVLPMREMVRAGAAWIDRLGVWGPVAYALFYAVATVLFAPGSILTITAGAVFGVVVGVITVSIGATTGAMLAFLIARYLAREKVAQFAKRSPKFHAIDQAVGEGGWKVVAMLRLSPVVPFNLQNYLYGLTPIRFWPCLIATYFAMLPGALLYVYIGHVAGAAVAGQRERSIWEWVLLAVGLIATAAVTIYLTVLARRKLQEETPVEDAAKSPPAQGQEVPESTQGSDGGKVSSGPWGPVATALLAILAAATAVYAQLNPDAIKNLLGGALGPPEVELREAYQQKRQGPTFDHSRYDRLLQEHVRPGGWVDYAGLQKDQAQLDRYLEAIAEAPFERLARDEKLALLINAYNAFTLKLILEHQPVNSIRDIPADQRWEEARWQVGSNTWSLNQIEHQQIRPKFREPRIHFALVCAAIGCPPLRREAYRGDRVERQLEDQAKYVHSHPRWVRFEPDQSRLFLTKLYKWYGSDFEQVAGSVLQYVGRYVEGVEQRLEEGRKPSIEWLAYDWALNSIENRPNQ